MLSNKYDCIIIGVGSMGSAAAYWLSKRGYKVLGLDQFEIPHPEGSHAGQSRIIRKAYFEHPDYVPLLERAYLNWQQLEAETGMRIYHKTGLLYYGPKNHPVIEGVKMAASIHSIAVKSFKNHESLDRYSQFKYFTNFEMIYESDAGFIRPELSVTLHRLEAQKYGAHIHTNEKVIEWVKRNNEIEVITDKNTYKAGKLIITAGAWASKMIPHLPTTIKATRQLLVWVKPTDTEMFSINRFPSWIIADEKRKGALYGFPYLPANHFGDPEGMKFAWHFASEETDPDKVNREITKHEIEELINQVAEYIPAVGQSTLVMAKTCLYENSIDEHFIIDHLPGFDKDVTIAGGFSGHGFKFVSVVGEILADLAMKGNTDLPVDFLSLKRFQKS